MRNMHIAASVLAAALLLTGCAGADSSSDVSAAVPASSVGADVSVPQSVTEPVSSSEPDESTQLTSVGRDRKDRVTGRGLTADDYDVTVSCSDYEDGSLVEHEAAVTDREQLDKLWRMLTIVEDCPQHKVFDSIGGRVNNSSVKLVPKAGGEPVTVSVNIAYYNEGEEGGPSVIVLSGRTDADGDIWYVPVSEAADGQYDSEWLRSFCNDCIARSESGSVLEVLEPETVENTGGSEIAVIKRYTNYAWGVDDKGFFIDTAGGIYSFSFAEGAEYGTEVLSLEELLPALEKLRGENAAKGSADAEKLRQALELAAGIPEDAVMKELPERAFDAGQHTLYINAAGRLTELETYGDHCSVLDDPSAEAVIELLDGLI